MTSIASSSRLVPLLLLLSACGKADQPAHEASSGAEHKIPQTAHDAQTSDQMFIDMMVPHHQGAVDMAQIALDRAEHSEIKAMAERIIASQQAEIRQMKAWRKDWFGSDEPRAMDMSMKHAEMPGMANMMSMAKDIETLKTATPFDLAFLNAMIPHHEGAIDMARDAGGRAQHPEVSHLSTNIIRDQTKEIVMMKEWRSSWYPPTP
jgi:uncharacterized protein (DUF305 family)